MKIHDVNKLYTHLTSKELGNLAFQAAANGNLDEADTITDYSNYHDAYMGRLNALMVLALSFGVAYWRMTALFREFSALGAPESLEALRELSAMNEALTVVCRQLKVDVNAMKQPALLGECDEMENLGFLALQARIEHYTKQFLTLVGESVPDITKH